MPAGLLLADGVGNSSIFGGPGVGVGVATVVAAGRDVGVRVGVPDGEGALLPQPTATPVTMIAAALLSDARLNA
jgi:hypothetical protein